MPDPGAIAHAPVVPRRVAQRSAQRVEVTNNLPGSQVRGRIRVSRQTCGVDSRNLICGLLPVNLPIHRAGRGWISRSHGAVLATGIYGADNDGYLATSATTKEFHHQRITRHRLADFRDHIGGVTYYAITDLGDDVALDQASIGGR